MAVSQKPPQRIVWVCKNCGSRENRGTASGRPRPGSCRRMKGKPHSWVIDKKY